MKIAPFRIEQYYAVHEFTAPYMLSSSDAESVAVADLLALEPDAAERLFAQRLGYTESTGAPELEDLRLTRPAPRLARLPRPGRAREGR